MSEGNASKLFSGHFTVVRRVQRFRDGQAVAMVSDVVFKDGCLISLSEARQEPVGVTGEPEAVAGSVR